MALGQLEAVEQLRQELNGGQELSARLWGLLSHPLNGGGREAALEMIKQISRVFMVTQLMLKPGDSSRVVETRMVTPEVTTERSIGRRSLTKDKRICSGSEEVTPPRNGREEITASPLKDGCLWRKYGKRTFIIEYFQGEDMYYYKCVFSHQRGCRAKKRVQRQDRSSSDEGRPVFQVTYVNEHTCQGVPLPDENIITATNTATKNAGNFAPANHNVAGDAEFDNDTLVSCLAMVIGGAAAPSSSSSSFLPPPAHVQARMCDPASSSYGRHSSPSLLDFSMGLDDEMATEKEASFFSCVSPFPFTPIVEEAAAPAPSLPSPPVEAISSDPAAYVPAGGEYWPSLDQMAEMNFSCGTLFPPLEELAHSVACSDGMSRGSWTQIHQEQPDFPSELPPAASSSSFSSVAWPFLDVHERWG